MIKNISKKVFILVVVTFINGCASIPQHIGYSGTDVATLEGRDIPNIFSALANNSATRLTIEGKDADTFYLKPGKHSVTAHSISLSIFSPLAAQEILILDLKANSKYKVTSKSSIIEGVVTFFLFDVTSPKEKLLKEFKVQGHVDIFNGVITD